MGKTGFIVIGFFLLLAGCAIPRPSLIELPPPEPMELAPFDLTAYRLRLFMAPGWEAQTELLGDMRWVGPFRLDGRASLQLIVADDCLQPLPVLAEAAAMMVDVASPAPARPFQIDDREGQLSGGTAPGERKVFTFAWREESRTFLLIGAWTVPEDGVQLSTMFQAVELLPRADLPR